MRFKVYKPLLISLFLIFNIVFLVPAGMGQETDELTVTIDGPSSGIKEISLQFNGSAIGGIPPYTWEWSFWDSPSGRSYEQNPSYAFHSKGNIFVKLIVTDSNGTIGIDQMYVNIEAMNVTINVPSVGYSNEAIQFTSKVIGGDSHPIWDYNWSWDFGDGKKSYEQNPIYTYNTADTYTVILTVTDDDGDSVSSQSQIIIYPYSMKPSEVWIDDDYDSSTSGWNLDHFDTIEEGINAVSDDGIINVMSGLYLETIVIDKPLSLNGENKETTIIDGNELDDVVKINADNVNLSGFSIQNSKPILSAGICVSSNYSHISNNIVSNNGIGIQLKRVSYSHPSKENTIKNNYVSNNYNGIEIMIDSNYNNVTGNTIDNNMGNGIDITGANNNIYDNYITNGSTGVYLGSYSYNTEIKGNTIDSNFGSGIKLVGSIYNIITGNIITNSNIGIHVYDDSYGNTISGNTYSGNYADVNYGSSISLQIPTSDLFLIIVYSIIGIGIIVGVIVFYLKKMRN